MGAKISKRYSSSFSLIGPKLYDMVVMEEYKVMDIFGKN